MSLHVIVVGAGIAGITTAIALRKAGHQVEIYEKSQFKTEIGAALTVTPNGARVLSHLGFSFTKAQAVKLHSWNIIRGDSLKPISKVDFSSAEDKFGAPVYAIHRVDLHTELQRLATDKDLAGIPVPIRLASEVVDASVDGSVILRDGTKLTADLIVIADGVHSVIKKAVLGAEPIRQDSTGLCAFRFLIDCEQLSDDASPLLRKESPSAMLLADTQEIVKERHIVCYPCRSGTVLNFVGIHPERQQEENTDPESVKFSMLSEFGHFDPAVLSIIRKSSHVKSWPLYAHSPLPRWHRGKIVLIGDAAHPMLPFGGQGANSAIEDGGSLGYLFTGVSDPALISSRLQAFEQARKARVSRIQILSSVRAGREQEVEKSLLPFADPPGSKVPTNPLERTIHDYSFDVFAKCDEVLGRMTDSPKESEISESLSTISLNHANQRQFIAVTE